MLLCVMPVVRNLPGQTSRIPGVAIPGYIFKAKEARRFVSLEFRDQERSLLKSRPKDRELLVLMQLPATCSCLLL